MKIYFVSLGCDKNLVDSEHMLGRLSKKYEITNEPLEADIAIVNTCAFIRDAKEESINTIIELSGLKTENLKHLFITGCLSQRYHEDLEGLIPEIDGFVGISATDRIVEDIDRVVEGEKVMDFPDINEPQSISSVRYMTPPYHTAYLKIAEGCDKHCTYCSIPLIRGKFRSIPMEELLNEADYLAKNGVSELILIAQETTVYGTDLYGKKSLVELVEKLSEIEELKWIRLMYCYPEEIDDELIDLIASNPKVCHYLDIPIQHSSDLILQKMGRRTSRKDLVDIISKLRSKVPDIALRTSLIAGFPGETEKEFADVLKFVKQIKFDRLGVFAYSREEGTPAYKFKNQVPQKIKKERKKAIMELQSEISDKKNSKMVGKKITVIIDGFDPDNNVFVGRSYKDAPDVDGVVFIKGGTNLMSGDFVKVKITDYNEYDLIGEI